MYLFDFIFRQAAKMAFRSSGPLFRMESSRMILSPESSPLFYRVLGIIKRSSQEKMRWSSTSTIIAGMTHETALWIHLI